jgi:predicted dehydrogenase
MTPRSPRVALIGHAFMGRAHALAWRNVAHMFDVPDPELAVLVGRNTERTRAAANRDGWAQSSTDWRDTVARADIDIVDICTPVHTHADIAIAALQAGKHVLVEKPLALDIAEASAMTRAAEDAASRNVLTMVGFNYRRLPALALAHDWIADGRLGRIRQLRLAYLQDWLVDPSAEMSWRLRAETAGSGALADLGSHAIDQVTFLTQDAVVDVSAHTRTFTQRRPGPSGSQSVTVDDAVWMNLGLDSGAVASVETSRTATGKRNAFTVEIYGEFGAIEFALERPNELWLTDATLPVAEQGPRRVLVTESEHPYLDAWWPTGHVLGWDHSFVHEIRDLLAAIEQNTPVRPSFVDGLAVQRVLDAALSSASKDGTWVPVRPAGDGQK